MRRLVERVRLTTEPYLIWNAYIDLLAMEEYADLSPLQRKAHLVFWYDAEVKNGGHGQYFENRGLQRLAETVDALTDLGLICQAQILSRAAAAIATISPELDWVDALQDAFVDGLDHAFHSCTPTVTEALEIHLAEHRTEYVEEA